jgi:23S rRNA (adenine2503-C2)-methyltransferase
MHLLDELSDGLILWLQENGEPKFRAAQIQNWLVERRAVHFAEMTNLSKALREKLTANCEIWQTKVVKTHHSADGTEKLLLEMSDGHRIECVLLREKDRRTICISTQVGCAMGCVFCASGLGGVERNLTTGEIIEQMLRLQHLLMDDERLSHIVVMGMGEPLANLDRLLPALDLASDPKGLGISPRRITISTVGLPPAIDRLTSRASRYHLAVSLHAPDDELRNQLIPVNKSIGIDQIVSASDRYFEASGRRLTFEYVLLAGVNDQPEHASALASRLRGRPALLNVIPYNPVDGLPYRTPTREALRQFREILEAEGINVMVRQRKGDKINAACGQLRRNSANEPTMFQPMLPG